MKRDLTDKQNELVNLVLDTKMDVASLARELGVSVRTIYNWKSSALFKSKLAEAREYVREQIIDNILKDAEKNRKLLQAMAEGKNKGRNIAIRSTILKYLLDKAIPPVHKSERILEKRTKPAELFLDVSEESLEQEEPDQNKDDQKDINHELLLEENSYDTSRE